MEFEDMLEVYRDDIIKSAQDLIRIKSVEGMPEPGMPYGRGPYESLLYVLNLSEKMGFRVKNVDGYAGYAEFGDGSETVGALVHVDVVPEGEGWTYPPFSGEIHDGKVFGRGAIDDKGPAIAILYAMKILKDSGIKLRRNIKVIFGTDEENGFDGINYYLSKEKAFDMGFTPDAGFPLISGEKGILLYKLSKKVDTTDGGAAIKSISGGSAPNMVPDSCKAFVSLNEEKEQALHDLIDEFRSSSGFVIEVDSAGEYIVLRGSGKTAHASTPEEGLNAVSILMLFLGRLVSGKDDVMDIISFYNEKIGMEYNGESLNCAFSDEISGKLTLNAGKLSLAEDKLEMLIDIRYLVSYTAEQIMQPLEKEFGEAGFDMEQLFALEPINLSGEHFLIQKLLKVYKDITKEKESKSLVIGGATYARSMKNMVAFGPVFPGEAELAHKSDEYISVENLMKLTKIYTYALYELAKG